MGGGNLAAHQLAPAFDGAAVDFQPALRFHQTAEGAVDEVALQQVAMDSIVIVSTSLWRSSNCRY
ncbi:MAG: hypothetical protein ABSF98_16420 [Bryobacteraceae bacterium]